MAHPIAPFIEHTKLTPDCALSDVKRLCEEALEHQLGAVCIPPIFVREARRILGEAASVKLVTVVGFPMGYSCIASKSEEIRRAVEEGTDDVDAVVNIAAIKSGNWNYVRNDCDSMARATHLRGKTLKLILECGLLTREELEEACALAIEYGVEFVQAGTGFGPYPVTKDMVSAIRNIIPARMKVKACGGIDTVAIANELIAAGADRIGTANGLSFIK